MTDNNGIRSGSLQFYPRVRAKKVVPSVNWKPLEKDGVGLMGFVGYKVGMVSVWAKDNTENSLTKGKRIAVPATVIECPAMRIYSVRFYKGSRVLKDFLVKKNFDVKSLDDVKDFDDVRVILASGVKVTCVDKKKADLVEIAISGSLDEKLNFVKENVGKEICVGDVFGEGLVDVRGVTKGFGTCGPVKRFGISLKSHKSEKGQRRPGSLAPWHPARVTFRAPMAGQTGYHSRISYNSLILAVGRVESGVGSDDKKMVMDINPKGGFEHYGVVRSDYLILRGSVAGPQKRGLVITPAIRPTRFLAKKKLEVLEVR